MSVSRSQVLAFRVQAQELDRPPDSSADAAILDIGVQDSGPDGALWALAIRGVALGALDTTRLATVWTVRAAPHVYRRTDLPEIAAAVAPYSEADAAKRIYDAAKPLKAAGIPITEALDTVAGVLRDVVVRPTAKGDASGAVTDLLDPPYLRFCRPCNVTHLYEMPFRLAALRAGLELRPGTSPPILERIPHFRPAAKTDERFDLIRSYLRFLGPATPKNVADYLDSPVADIKARWPVDITQVEVEGQIRSILSSDADAVHVRNQSTGRPTVRLLGPFDLFLQAKDRALLAADPSHAKALWPVLGRPGAVLADGEIVGTWRPRKSGSRLKIAVDPWAPRSPALAQAVGEQAELLAAHRGLLPGGVDWTTD